MKTNKMIAWIYYKLFVKDMTHFSCYHLSGMAKKNLFTLRSKLFIDLKFVLFFYHYHPYHSKVRTFRLAISSLDNPSISGGANGS